MVAGAPLPCPSVRQLLPEPAEVDPAAAHATAARPSRGPRPWVLANMVASVDGATALAGRSGDRSGPADKAVFSALRSVADVILVAAGTARAEAYGPPRTPDRRRTERVERGQAPYPRLALVSRSLDLDPTGELFAEAPERPLVFTVTSAAADRREALAEVADVVVLDRPADDDRGGVHLAAALEHLGALGAGVVLCEGGPSLLGQLVTAGLLDELDLTLAPRWVAGPSARVAHAAEEVTADLDLAHLWEADGMLFARYVRT
jgi:riboflavin biosynthesis pyrimidine reductase